MGVLSFLRSVYDLDTLDTRFTNASSTSYKTVIEDRNDPTKSKERAAKFNGKAQSSRPLRWKTPEFYLYFLIIGLAVPYMFWEAYGASSRMLVLPMPSALSIYVDSFCSDRSQV